MWLLGEYIPFKLEEGVCVCVCVCVLLSRVWHFLTPWTVAHQVPLSLEFPGKNTGVGRHALLQVSTVTCLKKGGSLYQLNWLEDKLTER